MCSEIPKTTIQVLFLQYVIQSFIKEKKTTRKQIKRIKKRNKHTLTLVNKTHIHSHGILIHFVGNLIVQVYVYSAYHKCITPVSSSHAYLKYHTL